MSRGCQRGWRALGDPEQDCSASPGASDLQKSRGTVVSQGKTEPVRRRLIAALGGALGGVALLALFGCNEYGFYQQGPDFRGITIPIPPPSLMASPEIEIDVDGTVPSNAGSGTEVYLFESTSARGYFTVADPETGAFVIEEVDVNLEDNCIRLWYVDGGDGEQSDSSYYKAYIETDAEICADETMNCSILDDEGHCACLDPWSTGC